MPYTHRGVPISDNHRPTPRLAKLMAQRMTNDIRLGSPLTHYEASEVTPAQAQNALNRYRDLRDWESDAGPSMETRDKAQQIYNHVYTRHSNFY